MINIIDETIERTNFAVLYDYKVGLFSIGFNIEENNIKYNIFYDVKGKVLVEKLYLNDDLVLDRIGNNAQSMKRASSLEETPVIKKFKY